MAFPFLFESNFERGTNGDWDSEADTGSRLNFPHYSALARYDATIMGPVAPFRGAFVAELDLGDTNDHTLIAAALSIANAVTGYVRFHMFLGKNLRATADDIFALFEFQGTANAVEASVGLRITAATQAIEIGVGQAAPTVFAPNTLTRGKWLCVELVTACSTGVSGSSTVFVDGTQVATIASLTNTAILRGVFGAQDTLVTTLGSIFLDQFVFDDTQVGPILDRFPEVRMITKSAHAAVGECEILNLTLLPGNGTNNIVKLYDTDVAYVGDENAVAGMLYNLTAKEPPIDLADVPMNFKRGCYVEISGTEARALVRVGRAQSHSTAGYRDWGNKRKNHPIAD